MYFVFDTETSGLPRGRQPSFRDDDAYATCRIVSIAWQILSSEFEVMEEDYFLIKPVDFTIPQDAINIHGITNEYAIEHGHEFATKIDTIWEALQKCTHLVGHNISFDFGVLLHELSIHQHPMHQHPQAKAAINKLFEMQRVCTMLTGKRYIKMKKFPKLIELHAHLFDGAQLEGAHNAQVDTNCCVKCFKYMMEKPLTDYVVAVAVAAEADVVKPEPVAASAHTQEPSELKQDIV